MRRGPHHASTLYLTLSWQPPSPGRHLLQGLLTTKGLARRVQHTVEENLALFLEGITRFLGFLAPVVASVMPLDADQLCTYLHQCVSWDTHAVRCPDPAIDLDWQLTSEVWVPGQPPRLGAQLLQPLTIKTWHPEIRTTVPGSPEHAGLSLSLSCALGPAGQPAGRYASWPGGRSAGRRAIAAWASS